MILRSSWGRFRLNQLRRFLSSRELLTLSHSRLRIWSGRKKRKSRRRLLKMLLARLQRLLRWDYLLQVRLCQLQGQQLLRGNRSNQERMVKLQEHLQYRKEKMKRQQQLRKTRIYFRLLKKRKNLRRRFCNRMWRISCRISKERINICVIWIINSMLGVISLCMSQRKKRQRCGWSVNGWKEDRKKWRRSERTKKCWN